MDGAERLQELAEMIGGQRITDTTRAQAQELLDAATAEFAAAVATPAVKMTLTARSARTAKKVRS